MFSFLWSALDWIKDTSIYGVGLLLVAGGAYLVLFSAVKPLRFVGAFLIVLGGDVLVANYFYIRGGDGVRAEWLAKNYEAKIDRLNQELAAKQSAADTAARQAEQLKSQQDALEQKISEYEAEATKLPVCRRATADDDRRLCDITGGTAAGCSDTK